MEKWLIYLKGNSEASPVCVKCDRAEYDRKRGMWLFYRETYEDEQIVAAFGKTEISGIMRW